jgi:hypothetical protein
MVHNFKTKKLNVACGDRRLRQKILSFLMEGLSEKYRQAFSMAELLLRIERISSCINLTYCFSSPIAPAYITLPYRQVFYLIQVDQ